MRRHWPALAACALLTAACGSTVQQSGNSGVAGGAAGVPVPGGDGLGAPLSPGEDVGAGGGADGGTVDGAAGGSGSFSGPGAPPAGPAAGTGGTGAAPGTPGTSTTGGTSAGGTAVRVGPGVTATTLAVGLPYITNAEAAGKALGISGAGGGDQRAQWKIVLDDINKRGGILGRKVVPVYHPIDATSAEPYDAQEQGACSDYHEDHKVFAVVDNSINGVLQACTEKAGAVMPTENASLSYSSVQSFSRYPHYVEVGKLRLDRMAANWPPSLQAQKYFTGWNTSTGGPGAAPVKVGILYLDDAASVYSVQKVLIPALAALGQKNPVVSQVQSPRSTSDNGATISAIQAAVVKFRGEGVTHFLPFDPTGGVGLFFAQNAENQKYYPRYGLTTTNGAQLLRDTGGIFPEKQLHGSLGYGWVPLIDLSLTRNPADGPNSNAARRACEKIMKAGGQNLAGAVQVRSAIEACDGLNFLKAALEAGGPSVTQASFLAGVHALGAGFVAGNTFRTAFSPQQHDGVSTGRLFAYDLECGCFSYTSPPRALR